MPSQIMLNSLNLPPVSEDDHNAHRGKNEMHDIHGLSWLSRSSDFPLFESIRNDQDSIIKISSLGSSNSLELFHEGFDTVTSFTDDSIGFQNHKSVA
ncbi:hypothetical protein Peur_068018 [Populus x canadensis]